VRRLGQLAMVAIALTFAACTPGAVKPTGAVTGLADACVGIIRVGGALPRVTVLLYSGPTVVASRTIKSGAMYRCCRRH